MTLSPRRWNPRKCESGVSAICCFTLSCTTSAVLMHTCSYICTYVKAFHKDSNGQRTWARTCASAEHGPRAHRHGKPAPGLFQYMLTISLRDACAAPCLSAVLIHTCSLSPSKCRRTVILHIEESCFQAGPVELLRYRQFVGALRRSTM